MELKNDSPTHIIDGIYIGDWHDADEYRDNFEIFTVAKESEFKGQHFYPLTDGPNRENEDLLSSAIADLINIRHETDKDILVHCVSGYSRSVAVVLGYMIVKGWTFHDAHRYMKDRRRTVILHHHFHKLLNKIEECGLFRIKTLTDFEKEEDENEKDKMMCKTCGNDTFRIYAVIDYPRLYCTRCGKK